MGGNEKELARGEFILLTLFCLASHFQPPEIKNPVKVDLYGVRSVLD